MANKAELKPYVVYPDKVKSMISIAVYLFFIGFEVYYLFTGSLKNLWNLLLILIMAFFIWQIVINVRMLMKNNPLLMISDQGIRDYTSGVDFGLIPWNVIEKVGTFPGQTSLSIGVLISNSYTFNHSSSKNAQKVAQRNRKGTGYSLAIEGLFFRRKNFKEVFSKFQEYGKKNNPKIIFSEYEDPFFKRANKNLNKHKSKIE